MSDQAVLAALAQLNANVLQSNTFMMQIHGDVCSLRSEVVQFRADVVQHYGTIVFHHRALRKRTPPSTPSMVSKPFAELSNLQVTCVDYPPYSIV